jgi:hypothetical protein
MVDSEVGVRTATAVYTRKSKEERAQADAVQGDGEIVTRVFEWVQNE